MNIDVSAACFEDGTRIIQYPSNGEINQFWRMERIGDVEEDEDEEEEREKKERKREGSRERG